MINTNLFILASRWRHPWKEDRALRLRLEEFNNKRKNEFFMSNGVLDGTNISSMLTSPDYKVRFKGEYLELKKRYEGLLSMIDRWEKGTLSFVPTCPREMYNFQLHGMKEYLDALVIRAQLEKVDLEESEG